MTQHLPFKTLHGFSKLFLDFIDKNEDILLRFPYTSILNDSSEIINKYGKNGKIRQAVLSVVNDSMAEIQCDEFQKQNASLIENNTTFFVTTGQQAGFLGGPFYTILKTFSAISQSEKLKQIHPKLDFIPLFWVEDNDHDLRESSTSYYWDKENKIAEVSCFKNIEQNDKIPISETIFDNDINDVINDVIANMPETLFKKDTEDFLRSIYKSGANPGDCFIHIINELTKGSGILFIKSSLLRKSGLWTELVLKELTEAGESHRIISGANELLIDKGYHIQAKSSVTNLFFHENKKRYKINYNEEKGCFEIGEKQFDRHEFLSFAKENIQSFSPNVLLRPVFQDAVLPNVVYYGGPSEIGYLAQLREVFDFFGVKMSCPMIRHSATLLTPRIARLLNQSGKNPEYFFRRFEEIEKELNEATFNKNYELIFDDAKKSISDSFDKVKEVAGLADITLKGSAEAALGKSLSLLEHLQQKVHAAEKRNNSLVYSRFNEIIRYLYPHHTLNERIFSVITLVNFFGFEELQNILKEISEKDGIEHFIFYIS